jgi:hypothetical protein
MDFKKLIPHAIAVVILMAVSAVFFAPNAFNGKVLPQPDNDKARAMQTEVQDYLKKDGKAPLWTNSAFGGMPAYQIYSPVKGNLTVPVYKSLFLWADYTSVWAQVFVAMFCMYLLLLTLRAHWQVAVFGALAYGITTYNIDLIEAGHSTKMAAIALSPGLLAGVVMTFNGRLLLGAGVTAMFVAMQIYANHIQITYYTLLLIGMYFVAQLADAVRHKAYAGWGKAVVATGIAIILGFACNLSRMWSTYEYSQETIRGGSELVSRNQGSGLKRDYQFDWSLGIAETMTILVPHAYGGGSSETIQKGAFYDAISRGANAAEKVQMGRQAAYFLYYGDQPFVGTAIYFGAALVFLFFLGLFLAQGSTKWWLFAGGLFALSLAWGKYFFLNDVWTAILPMFNKFRAVTMALGLSQLFFAALAAVGLQTFFDRDISTEKKQKALYYALGITAGLCVLVMIIAGGSGPNDARLVEQSKNDTLLSLVMEDRVSLARADAMRSLGFILAAAAILWFSLKGQLKAIVAVSALSVLTLADQWMVCKRTVSDDQFESKKSVVTAPSPEAYDLQIKQDKDLHYRVMDLNRGSITANWIPSYFHKSLTGYHAAKLQRFQEVVDTFLTKTLADNLHLVGMLNGKYLIGGNGKVIPNEKACGNAWFVNEYKIVPDADAEFQALHTLDPKTTAVVQQANAASLQGLTIQPDSTASIRLSAYHPDKMEYTYSAKTEQLAVFSEMYYPPAKGWKCYLNGKPYQDFVKANYLVRALRLPAGENQQLEMRFEPASYYDGEKVAYIASILVFLLFGAGLFFWFRKPGAPLVASLDDIAAAPVKERPKTNTAKAEPKGGQKRK